MAKNVNVVPFNVCYLFKEVKHKMSVVFLSTAICAKKVQAGGAKLKTITILLFAILHFVRLHGFSFST